MKTKPRIICDAYENHIASVKVGDSAIVSLNAFPDMPLKGTVSNVESGREG